MNDATVFKSLPNAWTKSVLDSHLKQNMGAKKKCHHENQAGGRQGGMALAMAGIYLWGCHIFASYLLPALRGHTTQLM